MIKFRFLIHYVICHPVAGVCWYFGFDKLGEAIHDSPLFLPMEKGENN